MKTMCVLILQKAKLPCLLILLLASCALNNSNKSLETQDHSHNQEKSQENKNTPDSNSNNDQNFLKENLFRSNIENNEDMDMWCENILKKNYKDELLEIAISSYRRLVTSYQDKYYNLCDSNSIPLKIYKELIKLWICKGLLIPIENSFLNKILKYSNKLKDEKILIDHENLLEDIHFGISNKNESKGCRDKHFETLFIDLSISRFFYNLAEANTDNLSGYSEIIKNSCVEENCKKYHRTISFSVAQIFLALGKSLVKTEETMSEEIIKMDRKKIEHIEKMQLEIKK